MLLDGIMRFASARKPRQVAKHRVPFGYNENEAGLRVCDERAPQLRELFRRSGAR